MFSVFKKYLSIPVNVYSMLSLWYSECQNITYKIGPLPPSLLMQLNLWLLLLSHLLKIMRPLIIYNKVIHYFFHGIIVNELILR